MLACACGLLGADRLAADDPDPAATFTSPSVDADDVMAMLELLREWLSSGRPAPVDDVLAALARR